MNAPTNSPEIPSSLEQTSSGSVSASTAIPDKKIYTLKEAALYLNVSTRTVERLIERRLLRRNKALRKILIPRSELDQFIEKSL